MERERDSKGRYITIYKTDEERTKNKNLVHQKANKTFKEKHPLRSIDHTRKYNFSLNKAALYNIFLKQNGVCLICKKPLDFYGGRDVHIDHNRACCAGFKSCGKCVRGFLCHGCNKGLGQFRDNPSILRSAAAYVEKYNG